LRNDPTVQRFIARNPGAPTHMQQATGMPPWLRWQHFFNLFLMTFIIRSGVPILTDHPRLYWTRHSTPGREWFRIQKAGAAGSAVDGPSRTRSACPSRSGCPVCGTRSGWRAGGI
jgi:hypothetical protein